ncbi:MAG: heme-copper oxidase subunit III [Planctomycetaceae bacterium]
MSDATIEAAHCLPPIEDESFTFSTAEVGVICVMICEAVMFATLLIAYLVYLGKSVVGPFPRDVLSLPVALLNTVFLVSSSLTIELAVKALRKTGAREGASHHSARAVDPTSDSSSAFRAWMWITAGLALLFLLGTMYEWKELIFEHGLTIGRNLFGTTYFTLIGCHALHVAVGMGLMLLFIVLSRRGALAEGTEGPHLLGWYWHLVDGVWIVLLVVVYMFGR